MPAAPAPRRASLDAIYGPGVWIWRVRQCENGDAEAIIARAHTAGLRQIWVRVGDTRDGFYAAQTLEALVPRAHAMGIAVIGWGFPLLYDPVGDARWSRAAVDWRAHDGSSLDGFSPDIETSSEGTLLSERRVITYLSLVRPAVATHTPRPLIATVPRPTAHALGTYPYAAMAPYIDAYAPMVYWSCNEPGITAARAVEVLTRWAPVHVIGQGYDMMDEGGRVGLPSGPEIARFCDAGRRAGALGASLWQWAEMSYSEWNALSASWWPSQPR